MYVCMYVCMYAFLICTYVHINACNIFFMTSMYAQYVYIPPYAFFCTLLWFWNWVGNEKLFIYFFLLALPVSYAIANIEGSLQFIMNVSIPEPVIKRYISSEYYASIVDTTLTLFSPATSGTGTNGSGSGTTSKDIKIPNSSDDSPFIGYVLENLFIYIHNIHIHMFIYKESFIYYLPVSDKNIVI